jgi:hypothetical protein
MTNDDNESKEPVMVTAGVRDLVQEFDDFLTIPSREKFTNRSHDVRNKYDTYRTMTDFDSEISSALTRISAVVAKAYDQPAITKSGNEELLEDVKDVLGEIGFEHILPNIVHDLSRDGDVVQVPAKLYKRASTSLKNLDEVYPVPINILTIIDSGVQKGMVSNYVIRSRDKYLLNESYTRPGVTETQSYPGDIVWHISLNNRGNWSKDIMGRNTFGVWGTSPLESLKNMVRWKYQSIRDDIAWRHENVPRTDHSVPLDAVLDINQYSGTMEERINAARRNAEGILEDYRNGLVNLNKDDTSIDVTQGYVHDANTKIAQVGGQNTYADCMNIVKKVDMSIATRLGIPLSALGYESSSSYAIGKVTVTFMNTFGLQLLSAIQIGTFDFVKRVIEARGKKYSKKDWNEIFLNYNVTDFAELKELIEAWTTAYKHGLARLGEGREGIGLNPIAPEDDPADPNNQYHPNLFQQSPFTDKNGDGEQTDERGLTKEEAQKMSDEGGDPALYSKIPIEQKVAILSQRIGELEDDKR